MMSNRPIPMPGNPNWAAERINNLESQVRQLRAERVEHETHLEGVIDKLNAENAALREVVEKWSAHKPNCSYIETMPIGTAIPARELRACNCGLAAALKSGSQDEPIAYESPGPTFTLG